MIFFLCDQILSCKMWRSTSNSTWWEKSAKILWQQYSTAAQQCIWKYFHKYFECYPFFLKEWISKDRRDCCYYWNGMIVVAILEVVWLATSLFYTADQDEIIVHRMITISWCVDAVLLWQLLIMNGSSNKNRFLIWIAVARDGSASSC